MNSRGFWSQTDIAQNCRQQKAADLAKFTIHSRLLSRIKKITCLCCEYNELIKKLGDVLWAQKMKEDLTKNFDVH